MNQETPSERNGVYLFGPFRLDAVEQRLYRDGAPVVMRAKALDLLLILVKAAGRLQTREELIQTLWPETIVEEHGLTVSMSALRKALGDEGETPRYIETVRGRGYRFIAPVTRPKSNAEPPAGSAFGLPPPPRTIGTRRHPARIGMAAALIAAVIIVAGVLAWRLAPQLSRGDATRTAVSSIAVLPFENLSADPANAYFVRGIQDLILTKLAGIGSLKVISRTSTERYPSHPTNLKTVARQLGVATVLEGSVQKAGDQVLINVQLINAHTGNHLWAEAYTREVDNVFDVESSVAQQVARALKLQLLPEESKQLVASPTTNPHAYDLFLQAEYLARQVERSTVKDPEAIAPQAVRLYQQAIEQDPKFALAEARLSLLNSYMYWFDLDHTPARLADARQAARRALALAPDLPEAHLAMGYVYYWGNRDYPAALREFEGLRYSLPNNANVIGAIAFIERRQGQWTEALRDFRQTTRLDPLNPRWSYELGLTLTQVRRYPEAEEEFNRSFSVAPQNYPALIGKVLAQLLSNELPQARRTLDKIPADANNPPDVVAVVRFELAWLEHNPQEALSTLAPVSATWIPAPLLAGNIPVSLLKAQAWTLQGDRARSRREYQTAHQILMRALQKQPDNPSMLSFLGMTEAGLGQKTAGIRAAYRATQLLPVSQDAIDGPSYLVSLAVVCAQSGETLRAVKLLRHLLEMPAGLSISVSLIRLDPSWDPIRQDPRFQQLLKEYGKQAPAETTRTSIRMKSSGGHAGNP